MRLLLTLSVGGAWVGAPDISTVFPAFFNVDHVEIRSYKAMPKAFGLIHMRNGFPDLPWTAMNGEVFNYVLCDRIPGTNWGAYLCSARGAVLQSLDEDYGGFIGIVAVTQSGEVRWGELDTPCADAVRNRLNTWLEARGRIPIPDTWTNRQVVRRIFRWANGRFDVSAIDITGWDE
jgi:hypothetical protein